MFKRKHEVHAGRVAGALSAELAAARHRNRWGDGEASVLLRRKAARKGQSHVDPLPEFLLRPDVLRVDPQPSPHRTAAHLHRVRLRRGDQPLRVGGVDANRHAALSAHGDRHIPADEKGETSEEPLLRQTRLAIKSRI